MFLLNFKNWLCFRNLPYVWIVNLAWIQLVPVFFFDKTSLVSESLLSQVLATSISYFFMTWSPHLFFPVPVDFCIIILSLTAYHITFVIGCVECDSILIFSTFINSYLRPFLSWLHVYIGRWLKLWDRFRKRYFVIWFTLRNIISKLFLRT